MATELDDIFSPEDIISSLLDFDDVYATMLQELQDIGNHLLDLETNPCSSLPFSAYLCNFEPESQPNGKCRRILVPAEQCVEPVGGDLFLNDYEFGLIIPNDLRPDSNNCTFGDTMIPQGDSPLQPIVTGADMITEKNGSKDQVDDDHDENEDGTDDDPKSGTLTCKNLVSERNRRRRISEQLLSLRTIVPNISKMDKRSVLVDALSYLRNILEETEILENKLKEQQQRRKLSDLTESSVDNPSGILRIPHTSAAVTNSIPKAQITEIDTEKIEDKRYAVKLKCKGGASVGSDVFRVFECLDFEIACATLEQLQPEEVLITIFVRVRKQGKMTEDKLKDRITSMALKAGLSVSSP